MFCECVYIQNIHRNQCKCSENYMYLLLKQFLIRLNTTYTEKTNFNSNLVVEEDLIKIFVFTVTVSNQMNNNYFSLSFYEIEFSNIVKI